MMSLLALGAPHPCAWTRRLARSSGGAAAAHGVAVGSHHVAHNDLRAGSRTLLMTSSVIGSHEPWCSGVSTTMNDCFRWISCAHGGWSVVVGHTWRLDPVGMGFQSFPGARSEVEDRTQTPPTYSRHYCILCFHSFSSSTAAVGCWLDAHAAGGYSMQRRGRPSPHHLLVSSQSGGLCLRPPGNAIRCTDDAPSPARRHPTARLRDPQLRLGSNT